jgi:hypothetical protein
VLCGVSLNCCGRVGYQGACFLFVLLLLFLNLLKRSVFVVFGISAQSKSMSLLWRHDVTHMSFFFSPPVFVFEGMSRCFSIPDLLKVDSVSLYETPQRFLLVGCVKDSFSLVKVDRSNPHELELVEDQHIYSLDEINAVLTALQAKKTCSGVGLLGFVKFVQGWYLLILVAKRPVGLVGSHKIFAIDDR